MDKDTLQTTFGLNSTQAADANTKAIAARESVRSAPPARVNPDTIGTTPSVDFTRDPNYQKITSETADRYREQAQQMTDVINAKYASKVTADKATIADLDSRTRVLNERRGVTGSGTGESAVAENKQKGDKVLAADEAARTAEIGAALGRIDQSRSNEQKANEAQARNDLTTAENLRVKNKTETEASIKSLATAGVDLETLQSKEPDTYQHLLKTTSMSPMELEAFYNNQKNTANQTKWQYKVTGDTVTAYGVDTKGNLKTQEQQVPGLSAGNYQIIKGDNGVLYKINKDTNEVTPLVNAAKPTKKSTTGGEETTQQKNEENDALNWLARQPGYDPKTDPQRFENDPQARAWAIEQAKLEKSSRTKKSSPGA